VPDAEPDTHPVTLTTERLLRAGARGAPGHQLTRLSGNLMTNPFRIHALAWTLLAMIGLSGAGPAIGQATQVSIPADHFVVAPGGVDMRTGRYAYSQTDLSIGGEGGLALTRTMPDYAADHANPFGNFSHNWDIMLIEQRLDITHHLPTGTDYRMTANFGGRAQTFEALAGATTSFSYKGGGLAAFLTYAGGAKDGASTVYTLRTGDGTVMTFRAMGGNDCAAQMWNGTMRRCAFVSQIVQPDGTTLSFDYASTGGSGNLARLRKVTSSRGYALLFEGSGSLVSKACVLNLAVAPAPTSGLCPSGVPSATYGYASFSRPSLASVVDASGATASFTYATSGSSFVMGFIKPGQSSAWLTNTFYLNADEELTNQEIVSSQSFADGRSYSYGYDTPPAHAGITTVNVIVGGHYTDNLGRVTTVSYGFPAEPGTDVVPPCNQTPCGDDTPIDGQGGGTSPNYQQTQGPVDVTDPLGRHNTADYCDPIPAANPPYWWGSTCVATIIQSFTDPEGIKTVLTHDGWNNITQVRRVAKPGSGLADIVTSATFGNCTTAPLSCTKPLTSTDPRGNTTTFTYDATHGGVLTETDPADSHGVQRVKRYAYVQRYAWVSDGAGGYVHGAAPMWLLSTEKSCNTSATSGGACVAGSGDEVTTTYDYGPDSGPNNLWLRGKVVTAGGVSLRSCIGYDAQGNAISQTSPRAGLTVCP
jgi:YD repeat-containing protein